MGVVVSWSSTPVWRRVRPRGDAANIKRGLIGLVLGDRIVDTRSECGCPSIETFALGLPACRLGTIARWESEKGRGTAVGCQRSHEWLASKVPAGPRHWLLTVAEQVPQARKRS